MNTRNIFMIAAISVSLGALNADAASMKPPSEMPEFDIPEIEIDTPRPKTEGLPYPGIYRSKPYLSIVIVPESVDPAFEYKLGVDTHMDDNVISPDTHLEPYQPNR
ncbi:MAG: hypothetical protein JW944_00065 [Deltaproteobacteria bacterium]|nr:hypothetical protein [Deltaproteobacteria bacterium]